MRNKNVSYVSIQKGNVLILVPTVRERGFGIENEMLWSLKEFDYKVFGYLDVDYVISSIINQKAVAGLPFYDIDMDMYNPDTYPDNIEDICKVGWDYAVMRLTHLYFDQLLKSFPEQTPSNFVISCRWHSNSHNALQIYPLDEQYISIGERKELCILFSGYSDYSEEHIEELLIQIGKCKKLPKKFEAWKPEKFEYPKVMSEHLIKGNYSFFLFRDGEIYCGMDDRKPDILLKVNWRFFAHEMINPKGCDECNPGYKMKVAMPRKMLDIFKHSPYKEYGIAGNNIYSVVTQIINIIKGEWKRIQKEYPEMKRIVFQREYDDKIRDKGDYMIVHYLDDNWHGPSKEIIYRHDGDYVVQDKELIANAL